MTGLAGMVSEFIHANYHIDGIVVVCFIVFASSVVQLLITAPRVIIDEEGIFALALGKRKFLWKEIRSAEFKYMHRSGDFITLVLHDNTRHRFMLMGVNPSAEEIYAEITANIREHGVSAVTQPEAESEEDDDFT
ncbi:hypothetical protein BH10CHL1_BH10CHL1_02980 [soil metagenome]